VYVCVCVCDHMETTSTGNGISIAPPVRFSLADIYIYIYIYHTQHTGYKATEGRTRVEYGEEGEEVNLSQSSERVYKRQLHAQVVLRKHVGNSLSMIVEEMKPYESSAQLYSRKERHSESNLVH
jgi:hypothetical protein